MHPSSPRSARLRPLVAATALTAAAATVLLGAPVPASAAEPTGTLRGSISFVGAPAPPEGSIIVTLSSDEAGTRTVRADARGEWAASGLTLSKLGARIKVGYADTSGVFAPVWWNGPGAVDPWALTQEAGWGVHVTADDPEEAVHVDLPAGAFVTGKVVRATPDPPAVPGTVPPLRPNELTVAYGTYWRQNPSDVGTSYHDFERDTAADGTFTLGPLPPVKYQISARGGFVGASASDPNRRVSLQLAPGEHRDTGTTTTFRAASVSAATACAACDDVFMELVTDEGTVIPQTVQGAWSPLPDRVHLEAWRQPGERASQLIWSGDATELREGQTVVLPADYGGTRAGELIKKPGRPDVSVVVGREQFLPLSSFGAAVDLGLGRSVRTVSQEARLVPDNGQPGPPPLQQRIDCGDETYFAGSGAAWPIERSLVAGLPATVLRADDALCAVLPRATGSTTRALFVKSASDATIWQIDAAGAKHAVRSLSTVTQLSAPGEARWLVVDPAFIAARPTGTDVVPAGALVKTSSSPRVYLADGQGGLVPISSFAQVAAMGLSTSWTTVPDSVVAASTVAAEPLASVVRCGAASYLAGSRTLTPVASALVAGLASTTLPEATCALLPRAASGPTTALFVKTAGSPALWMIDATGARRAVSSMSTVTQRNAPAAPQWLVVDDAFLDSLRVGPEVLPVGALVKTTSSPVIWWSDGADGLVALPSFGVAADLGSSSSWRVVPDALVSAATKAAAPLSTVLRCGSTTSAPTLLAGSGTFWSVSPGLLTGLAATTVPTSTCAVLPQPAGRFDTGVVVGTRTSPVLWSIDAAGTKHALLDMRSVTQLGGGRWATVDAGLIASLPTGADVLPPAVLVKTASEPAVYVTDGLGGLVPLASFDTAVDMGIPLGLRTVTPEVVAGASVASAPLAQVVSCGKGGAYALAGSGGLSQVPAPMVAGLPVTVLPASTCTVLPRVAGMSRAVLVKGVTDPVIWSLDAAGAKHAIADGAALARVTSPDAPVWVTVSRGFLDSRPTGTPLR